jgi:Xylose isomerase-like TIM barrel.
MFIAGVRAHDYGKSKMQELFSHISADGWKTIQLAFRKALVETETYGINSQLSEKVKMALSENGLQLGVLGAYVEPSMADEVVRRQSVEDFCAQIPIARYLSAGCIGTETTNMEKQPGVSREQALKCLRMSLSDMLTVAEQNNVTVAVEPVYYHAMNTVEETKKIINDMQSKWLGVIFDPVNILSPDLISGQNDLWKRAVDSFGDKIMAVHFKGVRCENGRMISCPLKESIVDYEAVFGELRQIKRDIPVLREEAVSGMAKEDMEFIKSFFE